MLQKKGHVVLPRFRHCCFSSSVLLAWVISVFLAVTRFRAGFIVLNVEAKKDGYLRCTKTIAERVVVSGVQSHSREYGMLVPMML